MLRIQMKQNTSILLRNLTKLVIEHDDPSTFIEYPNNLQNVYESFDDYSTSRKRKVLIIFDDMVADMISKNSNRTIY